MTCAGGERGKESGICRGRGGREGDVLRGERKGVVCAGGEKVGDGMCRGRGWRGGMC